MQKKTNGKTPRLRFVDEKHATACEEKLSEKGLYTRGMIKSLITSGIIVQEV
jgi:hypothetical protein